MVPPSLFREIGGEETPQKWYANGIIELSGGISKQEPVVILSVLC